LLLFVNSERYTFVTILNTSDKLKSMEDKDIFTWIGENQLKTAFREWWATAYPAETVPSYRTIQRAESREHYGIKLTNPQRRAERRAVEFQKFWMDKTAAKPLQMAA